MNLRKKSLIESLIMRMLRNKFFAFGSILILYICFLGSLTFIFWNARVKEIMTVEGQVYKMPDTSHLPGILLKVQINPQDVSKFFRGQEVEITLDKKEFPEFPLQKGKVVEIPYGQERTQEEYKPEVTIIIQVPPDKMATIQAKTTEPEVVTSMQIALRTERLLSVLLSKSKLKEIN